MNPNLATAFESDDQGVCRRVQVVGFDYDSAERVETSAAGPTGPQIASNVGDARQEAVMQLLEWLVAGQSDHVEIGRRTAMIAYLTRSPGAPQTQRDLAKILKISATMVNRILGSFPREFRRIRGLK